MKPLYTKEEFKNTKSKDKLPCKCYNCNTPFLITKKRIQDILNPNSNDKGLFCSLKCNGEYSKKRTVINCFHCNKEVIKQNVLITKNKHTFCSNSCSAKFNNKNKTWGTNRSKLEIWIEENLKMLYPNINIKFNDTKTIGLELDIYIPELKLAFEINGIFHYEPIFGYNKLTKTLVNDKNKFKICHEKDISLCVINTSSETYFKPKKSQKYLDIITEIINNEL